MEQCLTIRVPDGAAAGTTLTAFTIPVGARVKSCQVAIGNANCSGGSPAITLTLSKGAIGSLTTIATGSGHVTNDEQEITLTVPKTSVANLTDGQRLEAKMLIAGTTAVVSGVQFMIELVRPLMY